MTKQELYKLITNCLGTPRTMADEACYDKLHEELWGIMEKCEKPASEPSEKCEKRDESGSEKCENGYKEIPFDLEDVNKAFSDLLVNGKSEMILPDSAVREEVRRNMDNNMRTFGYTFIAFDGSECEGIINAKTKQDAVRKIKSDPDVERLVDIWEE